MDAQDKRIHSVLGDDDERTIRNAKRYRSYLLENLPLPVTVTGIEDFPWDEPYVLGGWDKHEYEMLKKKTPRIQTCLNSKHSIHLMDMRG